MADEKSTNQNKQNDQERGKAIGAAAGASYQDQRPEDNQPGETAGQGGGIQGSGQRQSNPGGYTKDDDRTRDESRGNEPLTQDTTSPKIDNSLSGRKHNLAR